MKPGATINPLASIAFFCLVRLYAADFRDTAVFDPDVASEPRCACSVYDHPIFDNKVEFWHKPISALGYRLPDVHSH